MDQQILEWVSQSPQDWWHKTMSAIYTWGKGSWNQLGHSTRENAQPSLVEDWKDVQQVCVCVCMHICLHACYVSTTL